MNDLGPELAERLPLALEKGKLDLQIRKAQQWPISTSVTTGEGTSAEAHVAVVVLSNLLVDNPTKTEQPCRLEELLVLQEPPQRFRRVEEELRLRRERQERRQLCDEPTSSRQLALDVSGSGMGSLLTLCDVVVSCFALDA